MDYVVLGPKVCAKRTHARSWRRSFARCCFCFYAAALLTSAAPARAGWDGLTQLFSGLSGITSIAQAPGDAERLFVGVKEGFVHIYHLSTGEFEPLLYLNAGTEVVTTGEGGLMAMAFHPNYQTNGKFYVTMTVPNGGIEVAPATQSTPAVISPFTAEVREYTVSSDPNRIDHSGFQPVISWVKPYTDHTGGWLAFGPQDQQLYIATGDGGGFLDIAPGHTPGTGNAQDMTDNLMGKLLRIDVDGDDFPADPNRNYAIAPNNPFVGIEGDDEIFANGLRSPWKASFDRATGDLWIGDVGEGWREEIDFIPAGSPGGQNFGWNRREGADPTPDGSVGGPPPARNVHPVYDYSHLGGASPAGFEGNSVTGGFVYRGPDPELQGMYVFADFISRQFWMFDPANPYGTVSNITSKLQPPTGSVQNLTTFFEDGVGNLYVGTLTGNVYRLNTDAWTPGDFQNDGVVDSEDLTTWSDFFGDSGVQGPYPGDANEDGHVNGNDFLLWQQNLGWNSLTPHAGATAAGVPEPGSLGLMAAAGLLALGGRQRRA